MTYEKFTVPDVPADSAATSSADTDLTPRERVDRLVRAIAFLNQTQGSRADLTATRRTLLTGIALAMRHPEFGQAALLHGSNTTMSAWMEMADTVVTMTPPLEVRS